MPSGNLPIVELPSGRTSIMIGLAAEVHQIFEMRRFSPIRKSAGYGEFLIQSDRRPSSISTVKLRCRHTLQHFSHLRVRSTIITASVWRPIVILIVADTQAMAPPPIDMQMQEDIIQWRRDLHAHPELLYEVHRRTCDRAAGGYGCFADRGSNRARICVQKPRKDACLRT